MSADTETGSGIDPKLWARMCTAEEALTAAHAIVDLLQGAAAHGAIEPPSNEESLAQVLGVARDLIEEAQQALWPQHATETNDHEEAQS